jgi:hypothetical protein
MALATVNAMKLALRLSAFSEPPAVKVFAAALAMKWARHPWFKVNAVHLRSLGLGMG